MQLLCPVQIGRESEIAAFVAAIDEVRGKRHGRAIAVAGEAGLGKSRLVDELLQAAAQRGMTRLVGECTPETSVPYAPFVAALRRRTRRLGEDELLALFDGPALLAASLLPEVARAVGVPTDGQWVTEDVFAAVWHVLNRLAGSAGAVLLLEDLHWADADTLRLLGYVVRELEDLPVLLVGTYRPDELHRRHPLQALLADLMRERRMTELRLKPLDREEARRLLSELFDGTEVGDEFLDAIQERAGGNPFILEELAKGFVDRGDVYHDGSDWVRRGIGDIEIPDTVRETVLGRCGDLDPAALNVLHLAAIGGDTLDPAVLARASGLDDDELDGVISSALLLQLLVERDDAGITSYTFRHALTREVFADELVGPDRRRAHLRVAEALLAEYGDDDHAAEIANHLCRSGQATRAAPFAIAAARRAARMHATEEAAERYEQALSSMPQDDRGRLELLIEAAKATFNPQDRRRALAFAGEARDLAQHRNDPVSEARALYVFERDLWHRGEHEDEIALLRQMLALVAGRDDREEAWHLRMLSRLLVLQDRGDEATPLIEHGIELASRTGHSAALSGLHGTRALRLPVGSPEWQEAIDAALAFARESDGEVSLVPILTNVGFMLTWAGLLGEARPPLEEAVALAARTRPSDLYAAASLSWVFALMGEYDRAVAMATPVISGSDEPAKIVAGCALAEAEYRRGDGTGDVVNMLYQASMATGSTQRMVPALAESARLALGDSLDAAWQLFERALATTNGGHWLFSPDAAAAAAAADDKTRLTRWVDGIRALTYSAHAHDQDASREADPNPHNVAAMVLCEGYLASLRTDFEAARKLFSDAAEKYAAMPCPARVAEAWLGLADAEWSAGEVAASRAAAERSVAVSTRIGASVLAARAEAAVARASSMPVLATVMFTDLVGSTQRAVAAGDTAWRATLERHHSIVRRELARFGGREIDTAGDGFLTSFDSPAQAIRCAVAIRSALGQIDLVIRVGIHTGECEVSGDKLTGLTVHIAARVSSSADADEVLVSRTVRDLVAGSGFEFQDRGMHSLKGVPGDWQLYAVC